MLHTNNFYITFSWKISFCKDFVFCEKIKKPFKFNVSINTELGCCVWQP